MVIHYYHPVPSDQPASSLKYYFMNSLTEALEETKSKEEEGKGTLGVLLLRARCSVV